MEWPGQSFSVVIFDTHLGQAVSTRQRKNLTLIPFVPFSARVRGGVNDFSRVSRSRGRFSGNPLVHHAFNEHIGVATSKLHVHVIFYTFTCIFGAVVSKPWDQIRVHNPRMIWLCSSYIKGICLKHFLDEAQSTMMQLCSSFEVVWHRCMACNWAKVAFGSMLDSELQYTVRSIIDVFANAPEIHHWYHHHCYHQKCNDRT